MHILRRMKPIFTQLGDARSRETLVAKGLPLVTKLLLVLSGSGIACEWEQHPGVAFTADRIQTLNTLLKRGEGNCSLSLVLLNALTNVEIYY